MNSLKDHPNLHGGLRVVLIGFKGEITLVTIAHGVVRLAVELTIHFRSFC
jgi:hypothetical protein